MGENNQDEDWTDPEDPHHWVMDSSLIITFCLRFQSLRMLSHYYQHVKVCAPITSSDIKCPAGKMGVKEVRTM